MHKNPVRCRQGIFCVVRELSKIKINEIQMSDYGCLKEHLPKTLGQTIYQSILSEHQALKETAGMAR